MEPMENEFQEYVTFHVTARDGSDVELAVVDEFDFEDKAAARSWFLQLRQLFIDWNYLKTDSAEFADQQTAIINKIAECRRHA